MDFLLIIGIVLVIAVVGAIYFMGKKKMGGGQGSSQMPMKDAGMPKSNEPPQSSENRQSTPPNMPQ